MSEELQQPIVNGKSNFWCFGCKKYHPNSQKAKNRKKPPFYCQLAVDRLNAARNAPPVPGRKHVAAEQYKSGESGAYFAKKFS